MQLVCACAGFVINMMKMTDFKGLCYFRFQEDTTVFLLFQFLTCHMETTEVGFILLYTTYYFSKSSQKPLKWIVFLRS